MRIRAIVGVVAALMLLALPAAAGGRPLEAHLDAANEVGPVAPGDPGTTATAHVTLNQGQGEVCFAIDDLEGNDAPIVAAHIHDGSADVNGPVVVDFQVGVNGLEGCVEADRDLIKDIRQNPGDYYVNIHNAVSPPGAARGQLTK